MKNYDILKRNCKLIYALGAGNFWYEDNEKETIWHIMYSKMLFLILDTYMFLEFCAGFCDSNMPAQHIQEAKTLSVTHFIMLIKRYSIRRNELSVQRLNKRMVEYCAKFETEELYKKQYRNIKVTIIVYVTVVYLTIFLYAINGVQKVLRDEPMITTPTYWPKYEDATIIASIGRVSIVLILCLLLAVVLSQDCLVMSHLIMLSHKFVTLRKYFDNLREEIDTNLEERVIRLHNGCREGILMHQGLLRLFNNIQEAFGFSMSVQVCLCSASAVLLLLQFALQKEMNTMMTAMTSFFIVDLLIMLALYLWNAGDLTYEASLLSNSIFQCGWHLTGVQRPAHRDVRKIVLLACAQAQKPLIMKAFGVSDLSYANFVAVVRTTYSVFAVLYNTTR